MKATRLPSSRSAATASVRLRGGVVADPYAAVEVEQQVVVAAERAERGARALIMLRRRASPRLPRDAAGGGRALAVRVRLDDDGGSSTVASQGATTPERQTAAPTGDVAAPARTWGASELPAGGQARAPRYRAGAAKPTRTLDPAKSLQRPWSRPRCGTFTIALAVKQAPETTSSFASLARQRLLRRPDLPAASRPASSSRAAIRAATAPAGRATRSPRHRRRTSATPAAPSRWPRPQTEPPGTSGSQFFVVTAPGRERLAVLAAARLRARRARDLGPGRRDADR